MEKVTWQSPSNIALIKYWGKLPVQIPMNPSISFTLNSSYTETTVGYKIKTDNTATNATFLFEGKPNPAFQKRINNFLHQISTYVPVLKNLELHIESKNSFPHSSGIASSASAMSALALCLVSIEQKITGNLATFTDFYRKSSFIARIGSGSAARSVYEGYTLWGETNHHKYSSNDYAIPINNRVHEVFKAYADAILIVSDQSKKVSSSTGHALMVDHPYRKAKLENSLINTQRMLDILKAGEQNDFALLTESEAMHLHAMMMTSNPYYLLMEPNTLAIIQKIKRYRENTKIPVCFTLDAGANVHFIYPKNEQENIRPFIEQQLLPLTVNNLWIDDSVGKGPKKVTAI